MDNASATAFWRFKDLKVRGIVTNRTTLSRWIRFQEFPPGVKIGPRIRVWPIGEVEAWLERNRP